MTRIPRAQMSSTQRRIAEVVDGAARRLGYVPVDTDDFTHAEQAALETLIDQREREKRVSVPRTHQRASTPTDEAPDVVRSITDRIDADHELRQHWPRTLAAINDVSRRMNLDTSKSASLRREYIETYIQQLRDFGRHNHTDEGDRAWQLSNRYERILRDGRNEDMSRRTQRDLDNAILRRRRAAS